MEKSDLINKMKEHASANGIKLNPDQKFVDAIITGLLNNESKYGPGRLYCPCRSIMADNEMNKKIICPCVFHLDEIKRDGVCHCGLFVEVD